MHFEYGVFENLRRHGELPPARFFWGLVLNSYIISEDWKGILRCYCIIAGFTPKNKIIYQTDRILGSYRSWIQHLLPSIVRIEKKNYLSPEHKPKYHLATMSSVTVLLMYYTQVKWAACLPSIGNEFYLLLDLVLGLILI